MSAVRLQQALAFTLGVWAAGAVVHEALAAFGAWATVAVVLIIARRVRAVPSWRRWWPLLALVGWAALAPLLAGRPPTATGLARLADWLLLPAAAFAVTHVSERSLPRIGLLVGALLLISCVVAASQYFGIWPRSVAFESLRWTKLPFNRMDEAVPGRADRFMAGGLLLHRIKFAHTGTVVAVMLIAAAVFKPPYRKVFVALAVLCVPALIVLPHARAAAVALVLAGLFTIALGAQSLRLVMLALPVIAVLVAALLWVMPSVRERFGQGLTRDGLRERELITQSGLAAIAAHPFAGEGVGRFKPVLYVPADSPAPVLEQQGKAHNQFISVAAEAGLPAAVFLVIFLSSLWVTAWRSRPAGVPLLGVLAVFVMLSLLHDPLFQPGPAMTIMLGLGAGVGLIERRRSEASSTAAARMP